MSVLVKLPDLPEENVQKLSNLLNEWRLQFLLPQFIAEKIDLEVLEIIDVAHINLLLSSYPIGIQIRFIHNLNVWRKKLGVPLEEIPMDGILSVRRNRGFCTASNASTALCRSIKQSHPPIHPTKKDHQLQSKTKRSTTAARKQQFPSKIDLKQILMNSPPNGPDLMDLYEKQQHFTPHDRKRLMSTIVNYFLECKMPLNLQLSYELENAIVQMFPSETFQKYRNSRYGKLYLLYLREKTEQMDSETFSEVEVGENQENNSPIGTSDNGDDDVYDEDDDDDGNVSDSLMCDLYAEKKANDCSDVDLPLAEEPEHDILLQTIYEARKKFVTIHPPYQYEEFLTTACLIFNISDIDNYFLYFNELKIDEMNFKSTILQHYKSITFTIHFKLRSECKSDSAALDDFLPDANFIRNIPNLLPYAKLSDEGKPLENSHRTGIAKTIIEECLRKSTERILKRQDFLTLAENICKAFHTEVPSTYYVPCRDAQPARGKLLNAYNNKRYTLSALGRLERRPRGITRKRKRYTYAEDGENIHDNNLKKLSIQESIEFSADSELKADELYEKWRSTHVVRQKALDDGLIKPNEYLNKYSILKTIKGIDLVEIDVKLLQPKVGGVDNWLEMYEMVVEKVRTTRNYQNLHIILEAIDNSNDKRYRASLTLNLLVYIFPHTWRFSKSQVQQRFLKEFKTMEALKSSGDPADLQIRYVHQSEQIVYAEFCVCGFIFKCVDLLEALTYLFYYIKALKLPYPRMCLRIWQFVQLAIFKVEIEDVMLPQIECTINDLFYCATKKKK